MNPRIAIIIIAVLAVALLIFAVTRGDNQEETVKEPTTFEECAALYPVMESFPRRCVTPSGLQFTEAATTTTTTPAPAAPSQPSTSGIPNLITVTSPTRGAKVSSPITVTGQARGTWYFEASFPVELRDSTGRLITQGPAEAQSDWMTENYVPFRASLSFPAQPAGSTGTLILRKSNASGDPARDQSVSIPVTF